MKKTYKNQEARNEEIIRLFNDGQSFGKIGDALGVSKSLIAGVIYRARPWGLITRPPRDKPIREFRLKPTKRVSNNPVGRTEYIVNRKRSRPWADKTAPGKPPQCPQEPGGCRYIFGDPGFSDWYYCKKKQTPYSSYCPEHHKLTHNGVPERPKKSKQFIFS